MDLGSLFSGFGSVPPNTPNPPPNTAPGAFNSGSWIIILIILFIVFRYSNRFPGLFSNPFGQNPQYPPPGEPAEPDKNSKKHHKHKHHHKDESIPYPPPQPQGPFGMFGQPGMM
jgi:hypothetical protein